MKLLITGCMGFIGSNLVSNILNSTDEIEVVGIDNLANPSLLPTERMKLNAKRWDNFKFYNLDICELDPLMSVAYNEKPDAIIHLAALGSVPRSFAFPEMVIKTNEVGFANMCKVASATNAKKFVFASSSSVYGDYPRKLKTEGFEGNPISPYALTKVQNEKFAKIWAMKNELNYIGLRFFNVYGPGQLPDSPYSAVIPKWINAEKIVINGDGSILRDFTFIADVCEAISRSVHTPVRNQIFNVGTGKGTNLNTLAKLISDNSKYIIHDVERPGDVKASIASTEKAKYILGFEAKTNIQTGIDITKGFYNSIGEQNGSRI